MNIAMNWATFEWIAAVITAVSVYLAAREHIWNWPTAIVSVAMYAIVYLHSGFYSDAGLQVVYFVLSIYGWYEWLHGGAGHTELHVSRASRKVWLWCAIIGIAFWWLDASVAKHLNGVAFPYIDAATTTVSLIAQWMMTRKILENWVLWIVVNLVYVPMLLVKHLVPTAILYTVLLLLAVKGLVDWHKSYKNAPEIPEPVPA